LQEGLVKLGTWLPFARAAEFLAFFAKATVGATTARRLTEGAGAAYVQLQLDELARLRAGAAVAEAAPAPGPAVQVVSVDGCLVRTTDAGWREVKTVAVGAVARAPGGEARAVDLSYFSRLAEAERFTEVALPELDRRRTADAARVVGVADGAEWCQGFFAFHRPDAVRVLDFAHAAGYLARAAEAAWGAGAEPARDWLDAQVAELKAGDPDRVLAALAGLPAAAAAAGARETALRYLGERRDQIRYAEFVAAGYPIGSGAVESANKLVVEARLKQAGMAWASASVDPMLALRGVACSDRWAELWPAVTPVLRARARATSAARRRVRRERRTAALAAPATALPAPAAGALPRRAPLRPADPPREALAALAAAPTAAPARPKLVVDGKPTAAHPWKRPFRPRSSPAPAPPSLPSPNP
jgi:hypothetical protein